MEDPIALARSHVETADVPRNVVLDFRRTGGAVRGADDHCVAGDRRGCMEPYFAGLEIDLLIVVKFQIDDAVLTESGYRNSSLGVQRDQAISGRDVEDPLFAPVGPIGQPAARKLPRSVGAARTFIFTVHP